MFLHSSLISNILFYTIPSKTFKKDYLQDNNKPLWNRYKKVFFIYIFEVYLSTTIYEWDIGLRFKVGRRWLMKGILRFEKILYNLPHGTNKIYWNNYLNIGHAFINHLLCNENTANEWQPCMFFFAFVFAVVLLLWLFLFCFKQGNVKHLKSILILIFQCDFHATCVAECNPGPCR